MNTMNIGDSSMHGGHYQTYASYLLDALQTVRNVLDGLNPPLADVALVGLIEHRELCLMTREAHLYQYTPLVIIMHGRATCEGIPSHLVCFRNPFCPQAAGCRVQLR